MCKFTNYFEQLENMKYFVSLLFIAMSSIFLAQEWNRDTSDLNGPVKAVYYVQTDFISVIPDNWEYLDTKTEFDERGKWIYRSNFLECKEFNTQMRIYDPTTGRRIFDIGLYEGDTTDSWQMIYNKKGQIIKQIHLKDSKKDSSYFVYKKKLLIGEYDYQKSFSVRYFYKSKKKLIRKETIRIKEDSGDTTKYFKFYDDNGKMVKDSTFSKSYISTKTWQYDKDGRLIVATSLLYKARKTMPVDYRQSATPNISYVSVNSTDDRNSRIEYEYEYNQKGQLVRMTNYFIDGNIRREYQYEYNEHNLVTREIFRGNEEHHHADTKFEYTYDSYGNWILRYSFDLENSEYFSVEYRKIEYFD